ncbi:MAG: DedA family protein [Candidatus Schekmanbacteria bacterium]|nr:MAG: DedA family protein [Candidatus Schekmanbacteria bacterium]
MLRKLYDWVLHWADTPYGAPALFLLAFAESSFFPIPPDVLLIALVISKPRRAFKFALICSIGSALGGMLGYGIGKFLWEYAGISYFFFHYVPGFTPAVFDRVSKIYNEWNFWAVFTAGFTPIPYKVFTIAGGVFSINFPVFVLASVISRSARFFIVAGLLWKFGEPIREFIDKYFNILSIIFVILLLGGFILLKYVF